MFNTNVEPNYAIYNVWTIIPSKSNWLVIYVESPKYKKQIYTNKDQRSCKRIEYEMIHNRTLTAVTH